MTRLDRIIARCEADLQTPEAFEGSGALITWRRATALRLIDGGAEVATAAGTTGLSPERVARVVSNVRSHGLAALAPSFDERAPERISGDEHDAILSAVGAVGVRRLSLQVFADRVVAEGIVADISHPTLAEVLGLTADRAGRRTTAPLATGLTRRVRRWVLLFWVVSIVAWFVLGGEVFAVAFSIVWLLAFVVLIVLPLALTAFGLRSSLHGRRLRRTVERLSTASTWSPPIAAEPSADQPAVEVLNALALPVPTVLPPPLAGEVLYLWVFDAPEAQIDLMTDGWVELAPTRLLTNVDLLSAKARRQAMSRPRDEIVATRGQLDRVVGELSTDFGRYPAPRLNVKLRSRRYDGYPFSALVCTAGMWHAAFDALLARSGLVVINLSGFDHAHDGLAHELRHALRPPSPAREVFLVDANTDADAAIEFVIQIATEVAATSPLVFVRLPAPDAMPSWSDVTAWFRSGRSDDERRGSFALAHRVHARLSM